MLNTATETSRITYEDFLAQADEDVSAEWVDGEVILMSPASDQHQDLADFLTALLRLFAEEQSLGKVRSAPFQMKTGPDLPGREPDVLFVSHDHLDRLRDSHLDGPADLAIEIISRDSRGRDRGEKFYEYEQGGVSEYWMIDPLRGQAEFYRLGEDSLFHSVRVTEDGMFESAVLKGLWLRVEWLWQRPPLLEVIRAWNLI